MTLRLAVSIAIVTLTLTPGLGQSVVDPSQSLKLVRSEFGIADGAAWDGRGVLYVPDVKEETLFAYSPNQNKWRTRLAESGRISATFFQLGRLYMADNAGQRILVLPPSGKPQVLAEFAPGERPNDLVVDKRGGVYVTMTKQGEVRYVSPQGPVTTVASGVTTPNGLILSPDGKALYVSEFVPRKVIAFEVQEQGNLSNRRDFATMEGLTEKGADGMSTDRAGNVYCSGPDGVWIWDSKGKLLDKIKTPSKAINCVFGGDGRSLFISTLGHGLYEQRMLAYGREPHPPASAEHQFANGNRPHTTIPKSMTAHLDVVFGTVENRNLLMDVFVPAGAEPKPTVVVVHGGGWLKGDKTKFRALSIKLARLGYTVAAVEYRLGFEARFPAGVQDCNAAVRFLRANAEQFSIDPQRIAAVGGSAGGHIVGLMAAAPKATQLQGEAGNSQFSSKLQAAIVMAGPMQMLTGSVAQRSRQANAKSNSNQWLGKTVDEAPDLYQLADAYEQLSSETPPILFLSGSLDNPDRNLPARQKLKELGVWTALKIYPDAKHGVWNQTPWIDDYVEDIGTFLQAHLQSKP